MFYGIYDFSVLLSGMIGQKVHIVLGFISLAVFFILAVKGMHMKMLNALLFLLAVSINSSYTSIGSIPYSRLPLTWFFVASVGLIFLCYIKVRKNLAFFSAIFFCSFFVVSLLVTPPLEFANALNQMVNILVFLLLLSCVGKLKDIYNARINSSMMLLYLGSVFVFSLMIIVQKYLYESKGISVGHIGRFAKRISYAATFYDFSFATLYVASGFCLLLAGICYKKRLLSWKTSLIFMVIYLYAILLINARTGMVALVIGTFLMFNSLVIRQKRLKILLIEICAVPIVLVLLVMMSTRRADMFGGSGRLGGYILGLQCFARHFLFGSGFGSRNYVELMHTTIPHNFFIQYLAQFGMIGFLIIFMGFFPVVKKNLLDRNSVGKWALVTIIVGAMFIPDIINSHFLSVILLVAVCETYKVSQSPFKVSGGKHKSKKIVCKST